MRIVGLTFKESAPVFTCPVCGKEYKSEDSLKNHIKTKHPEAVKEPDQELTAEEV